LALLQIFCFCDGRYLHFDTTEVTEEEFKAVLNTLMEHDFQEAFTKWQRHWEWCIHMKGDYIEGDGGQ
jgi:hypothetical protein